MKYFIATEFIRNDTSIDLISIGIVSDQNKRYYAVNYGCDFRSANEDTLKYVLTPMGVSRERGFDTWSKDRDIEVRARNSWIYVRDLDVIKRDVIDFIGNDDEPSFYSYNPSHDWEGFTSLISPLPVIFPSFCYDIQQEQKRRGISDLKLPPLSISDSVALHKAVWNKQVYDLITA